MWYLLHDPDDSEEAYIITEFINDKPRMTSRWKPTAEICSTAAVIPSNYSAGIGEYTCRYPIVHSTETLEEMKLFILLGS